MEDAEEFEKWLFTLLLDAKRKLNITDKTIAYILLREGTEYFLKQIIREEKTDGNGV